MPIFTVGIGDTSGAAVPDEAGTGAMSFQGQKVRSRLTEETLTAIAKASGGRYVPLGTASTVQTTLGSIFRQHLRQISARDQQETMARRRIERYQLFLYPALGFLLAAAWLSRGRLSAMRTAILKSSSPPLPLHTWLIAFVFAASFSMTGSTRRSSSASATATWARRCANCFSTMVS